MKKIKQLKGFTLIELLIVIAIIGILAGILFVSIGQSPLVKSRDTKRTADLQNLRLALTLYYTDNNQYPAALANLAPTYVPATPVYPRSTIAMTTTCTGAAAAIADNGAITAGGMGAGNYNYKYSSSSNKQHFILQTCLEDGNNSVLTTDSISTGAGRENVFDIAI